jgi:receptor protein-tyrosine kinase
MSKNFELLQQASKEEWFAPAGMPIPLKQAMPRPTSTRDLADEEIAKLVQRLYLRGDQTGAPKVISFSGIEGDDRSSWICARAGESLASQTEAQVCVVDANTWAPQLHTQFGVGNLTGLAESLTSEGSIQSYTTPLSGGNLWLLPAGSARRNLCTKLDRCRARFAELRADFNYILISAPPLTREADATMIGQLADGVVLIVEANHSRREALRRTKARLEDAEVSILGAVLDQRTFPIPEFLYRKL